MMADSPNQTAHVDVQYVADLARISLTQTEIDRLGAELDAILEYVRQLSEVAIDGIEPTAHAVPRSNVMRDDLTTPCLDRELVVANAPATVDDMYVRVPVVIDEEGA
jgi:aspartyl-tRNA(Asn)/glutamyl-tRNA(Gln) amidotransferase subunit C